MQEQFGEVQVVGRQLKMHIAELLMMAGGQADPVPAGLIVFLNDTSIPSGWTRFSAADDKMLIGAGDSYAVTTSAGSSFSANIGSPGGSNVSAGAHTHGTDYVSNYGTTSYANASNASAGAHSHPFGDLTLNEIDRSSFVLIKADSVTAQLPTKAAVLGVSAIAGLTNIRDTDKCICGGSTNSDYNLGAASLTLVSAGSHGHGSGKGANNTPQRNYPLPVAAGAHSPTITLTTGETIPNLKRLLLSIWSNASADFNLDTGMIAMYESATPPIGWRLCDGTNETPNLEDHFIESVTTGDESTSSTGNNTVNLLVNRSISHSAPHSHGSGYAFYESAATGYIDSVTWSHSHSTVIDADLSFLPSYYALTFIMKN